MKKLLVAAIAFFGIGISAASATCSGPAVMHDFAGTAFNMSLLTNSADGNCASVNALASWGGVQLGAATAWGTAPSGVVPGVNANVLASVLPTGAATSANQTGGGQKTQVVDASGNGQNAAIAPVVSTALESSHVLKASAGQVQGVYAVNTTSVPGFLVLLNATSVPADGAITPLAVAPLPPNGSASISPSLLNPMLFSTGIVAVLTSATTPFTKTTTGGLQGFISCQAI